MGETFKRLWARLLFWRKPVSAPVAQPTEIVGAEYLEKYQEHYKNFQREFLSYIRANPDAEYWQQRSIIDVGVLAGNWSRMEYGRVPNDERVIWWAIAQNGKPEAERGF